MKRSKKAFGWLAVAWCIAGGCTAAAQSGAAKSVSRNENWIASWSTAVVLRPQPGGAANQAQAAQQPPQAPQAPAPPPIILNNQTLRQIVHLTLGGTRARVVLTNTFGTAPLTIGAADVALRDNGARIVPGSARALTFGGRPSVTIPAGAVMFERSS